MFTDNSEEHNASIFRAGEYGEHAKVDIGKVVARALS
jgi:hypothetical protein